MILLTGMLLGLVVGLSLAAARKQRYEIPPLRAAWLAIVAFVPQLIAIYLPATKYRLPAGWASAAVISSQAMLLVFCWLNRKIAGMWLLALGLGLNLLVILLNHGFMPISPEAAARFVPSDELAQMSLGSRFGHGKDILLLVKDTRLPWLSDRLLPPAGFPYQFAFSLGDSIIAIGAFWITAFQGRMPGRSFARDLMEGRC